MSRRGRGRYLDGTAQASRVANTGYRGFIKSIQRRSFTLVGVATNTDTITQVDISNSIIRLLGVSISTGTSYDSFVRIALVDATTVRATRVNVTGTVTVSYEIIEYYPGVIKTIRRNTITLAAVTSATDTFAAVNTAKTSLEHLGNTTDDPTSNDGKNWMVRLTLTNSTTITANVGNALNTLIVSYQLVEYY